MLSQFAARLYSNWSAKKKLNLLFVFNKYLQDSMKRQETKDWAEVFDHLLSSILPDINDARDAMHISKLLKHWQKDELFPENLLNSWQQMQERYFRSLLDNQFAAHISQSAIHSTLDTILESRSVGLNRSPVLLDEKRIRNVALIEEKFRVLLAQTQERFILAMRNFLYEAYRHFIRGSVSLNDALHWRVVITSSFWLLNQYLLQEFFSCSTSNNPQQSNQWDNPLVICLACIYLSGKSEQYFIRSEKLRVVAQKYMHTHFNGIVHPNCVLPHNRALVSSQVSLPGDASLFQMELKLLRLVNYNIAEIRNPCRTLRDWLLHKRIDQETFQKTTAMIVKEDHLLGHFNFGFDAFDHDNVLAFFLLLAGADFSPTQNLNTQGEKQPMEENPSQDLKETGGLVKSLDKIFSESQIFHELQWNEQLLDMVLSMETKPLCEIGIAHSSQFVRVFQSLWGKYYSLKHPQVPPLSSSAATVANVVDIPVVHVVTPNSRGENVPPASDIAVQSNSNVVTSIIIDRSQDSINSLKEKSTSDNLNFPTDKRLSNLQPYSHISNNLIGRKRSHMNSPQYSTAVPEHEDIAEAVNTFNERPLSSSNMHAATLASHLQQRHMVNKNTFVYCRPEEQELMANPYGDGVNSSNNNNNIETKVIGTNGRVVSGGRIDDATHRNLDDCADSRRVVSGQALILRRDSLSSVTSTGMNGNEKIASHRLLGIALGHVVSQTLSSGSKRSREESAEETAKRLRLSHTYNRYLHSSVTIDSVECGEVEEDSGKESGAVDNSRDDRRKDRRDDQYQHRNYSGNNDNYRNRKNDKQWKNNIHSHREDRVYYVRR
jgi:hypothetical protein